MKTILLLVLLGVIMTSIQVPAADSPWLYGIHWFGPPSNNSDVAEMTGGKPIWVLETLMTNEGASGWGPEARLDNFRNVVDQGHTLIIRVQPVWGKAFPLPEETNPSMETFLDQVGRTAELYKDVCHIWQLGNEMNLDFEWGDKHLAPEDYIDAAALFSDRIRDVTSSLGDQRVLVGPVSPGDATGPRWMSSTEYLSRMCDAINKKGYRRKFQGFAIHSYAAAHTTELDVCLYGFDDHPENGFRHQLYIIDAKGFEEYPVYMTEWNRYSKESAAPEEAASAQFLHRALAALDSWNRSGGHPVACACWFVYSDSSGWGEYTLKGLKSEGNENEDVWHAFEYAAGQDYLAGFPKKQTEKASD
jgi:hypothetical protein